MLLHQCRRKNPSLINAKKSRSKRNGNLYDRLFFGLFTRRRFIGSVVVFIAAPNLCPVFFCYKIERTSAFWAFGLVCTIFKVDAAPKLSVRTAFFGYLFAAFRTHKQCFDRICTVGIGIFGTAPIISVGSCFLNHYAAAFRTNSCRSVCLRSSSRFLRLRND